MGILRSFTKVVSGSFFSTLLIVWIFIIAFIQLTEYENLKPVVTGILAKSLAQSNLTQLYTGLSIECQNKDVVSLPVSIVGNVTLSCKELRSTPKENFSDFLTTSLFNGIYYRNYTCEFVDCIRRGEYFALFSSQGNSYLKTIQPYVLLLTVLLLIIFVLSLEGVAGKLKGVGATLISISLPFVLLFYGKDLLFNVVGNNLNLSLTIDPVLNSMLQYYLPMLIIGVILVSIGYVIKRRK